jgi:hypothetical protein
MSRGHDAAPARPTGANRGESVAPIDNQFNEDHLDVQR